MLPFLSLFVMKECASMDTLGNYRCLSGCNNNNNRSVCCFTCLCCFNAVSYRCLYRCTSSRSTSFSAHAKLQILTGARLRATPPFHGTCKAEIRHFDITSFVVGQNERHFWKDLDLVSNICQCEDYKLVLPWNIDLWTLTSMHLEGLLIINRRGYRYETN